MRILIICQKKYREKSKNEGIVQFRQDPAAGKDDGPKIPSGIAARVFRALSNGFPSASTPGTCGIFYIILPVSIS
jgi:hypothetical protein